MPVKPRTEVDIGAGALRESGAGDLGESEPGIDAGSQGDRGLSQPALERAPLSQWC